MQEYAPRLVRPVADPLPVFLRPGRNDHVALVNLLSERNPASLGGLVLDATLDGRHEELYSEAVKAKVARVLDPRVMELATLAGERGAISQLVWAPIARKGWRDLDAPLGRELVRQIVEFAANRPVTAVLAPAHILREGAADPWLSVDQKLVYMLREELDSANCADVSICYPLSLRSSAFRTQATRQHLKAVLSTLPIDSIWLRVYPFGSRSGAAALKAYVQACWDLGSLGIPLVAERTGSAGIALLAFGGVGGIESGVTLGENFNPSSWFKPIREGSTPFSPAPRIYLHDLGVFLDRNQAVAFFDRRFMKSSFGCRDHSCCRRGHEDMIRDPRRHFMIRRFSEAHDLSATPQHLRARAYLDSFLRPATDLIIRASKAEPALESHRRRLDSWRSVLSAMVADGLPLSTSAIPTTGRLDSKRRGA